jgi:Xaa-Pro aminopeptidase
MKMLYVDIARAIRPGTRENELVAIADDRLLRLDSERVECGNSVSGPRGRPHSHTFSDRIIQPGGHRRGHVKLNQ